jgi:hypothetical protein
MANFYIGFDGASTPDIGLEATSLNAARDQAIVALGAYLQDNPAFAHQRHWRVDLKDGSGRHILYVIVACVEAAPKLNFASFDADASNWNQRSA